MITVYAWLLSYDDFNSFQKISKGDVTESNGISIFRKSSLIIAPHVIDDVEIRKIYISI